MFVDILKPQALPFLPIDALGDKGTAPGWVSEPLLSPNASLSHYELSVRESMRYQAWPSYSPMEPVLDNVTEPEGGSRQSSRLEGGTSNSLFGKDLTSPFA